MTDLALQSRFAPTARVGGRDLGAFHTFAGGRVGNDAQKDRPPGAKFPVAVPGAADIENITLTRTVDADRTTDALASFLEHAAEIGSAATIGKPILDANNNPKSRRTYIGIIVGYKGPDTDSNSSDKGVEELEFQISGIA